MKEIGIMTCFYYTFLLDLPSIMFCELKMKLLSWVEMGSALAFILKEICQLN